MDIFLFGTLILSIVIGVNVVVNKIEKLRASIVVESKQNEIIIKLLTEIKNELQKK